MYVVYDSNGIFYYRTMNEVEADCISYCIGGYYIREEYNFV